MAIICSFHGIIWQIIVKKGPTAHVPFPIRVTVACNRYTPNRSLRGRRESWRDVMMIIIAPVSAVSGSERLRNRNIPTVAS